MTPVRSHAAWGTVTGTFRTVTLAPGCPQAARNSGGIAPRGLGGEPHPAIAAVTARMVIPAHARPGRGAGCCITLGRGQPVSGSQIANTLGVDFPLLGRPHLSRPVSR